MSAQPTLPAWLTMGDATPAKTIGDAVPGLERAQTLSPLQRVQYLRTAALSESHGAGVPIDQIWRMFLRGNGPSTIIIDATGLDPESLGSSTVLDGAPWLVAEGVMIALGLRDSGTIELRLTEDQAGDEATFLNTVDSIRSLAQISVPGRSLEVKRASQPTCWGDRQPAPETQLVHDPETWCRIALSFAGEQATGASLITLRQGLKQRGLVQMPHDTTLKVQVDNWGGSNAAKESDPVLAFDGGMGGFLPLSSANVACDPVSLASVGIIPAPSSLMVMAEGVCVVKQTRRALYRNWQLAEDEPHAVRGLLARAARLTAEVTLGRGDADHMAALDEIVLQLAAQGLAAAWPLASSLRHYRDQWESHARREACSEGICLERQAAPCHRTCPANIDIPSFIAHIGHGDYRSAVEVIRRDNPLPLVCGLICPAACESACVRGSGNGAVFIRPLKATAAEHCLADGGYPQPDVAPDTGKRIGIIGSGPSGLTAAFFLRLRGHTVDIHEEQEHAGGMLRYGIPSYRLPTEMLDKEVDQILELGVQLHTGAKVDSLDKFRKDYDAVFLGLGTQLARMIAVDGAHLPFVQGGIDFLRAVRSSEPARVGPRVVVVGGGNVAIDVALTALRQGAQHVDMVSLEKRREMPAGPDDIQMAVDEGVELRPGWGPLRVEETGRIVFQYCERTRDETGRFNPEYDPTRLLTLEADHVLLAVGQGTDLTSIEGSGLEVTRGFIVTDPKSLMTNEPGVFAGGDVEHGPRTAVEAIRSGKIAADSIDAWLSGGEVDASVGEPIRRAEVPFLKVPATDRTYLHRATMPERTVEEVLGEGNYVQVEEGLTDAMAHDEARRCLRCDVCIGCGLCMAACSEMGVEALRMTDTPADRLAYFDFERASSLCIGCGACMQVCPTAAIRIEDLDGVRRTVITGTVVQEQPLLACSECGAPTRTPAHRNFVRDRLPDHMATLLDRELCPSCARLRTYRPNAERETVASRT